jgi:hypothetical protein
MFVETLLDIDQRLEESEEVLSQRRSSPSLDSSEAP